MKPAEKTYDLATLKRYFEDARDLTYDARKQSQIDQDYYDGHQWTADERNVLRKRKQPDNVFNFVGLTIDGTLGVLKRGATDPRAFPRNPQDEDSADVASKSLRFIADYNRFDSLKLDAALDYLIQGTMAAITEVDEDRKVTVTHIRWEEFFYDPRSRRKDFADARYMGVAKWQYADDLARMYPEKATEINMSLREGAPISIDETFEDRPKEQTTWIDQKKRRLMTVELYHNEGGWRRCVFTAAGVLMEGESPFVDEKGRPTNPIEAQSCFVDRENNRYGMVRRMRGPQDEINKRHSKLLHELSNRQVREGQPGAVGEHGLTVIREEAARPDGVLPYGIEPVQRSDITSGQAALLGEGKSMMERMGPSPEMLGRQNASSSGRAQLVRQEAGLTELAIIYGGVEDWELRIYRQMWARARQFWKEPMFIRVTDDEGAPEFVQLNQPQMGPPEVVMDPETGVPTIQPRILGYENAIAELDVDITIDSVPDTANIQAEQFQQLVELAKVYPQEVTFDDLLELSAMPNKRQLMEKRKARQEQAMQTQQQNPAMQMQMQAAQLEMAERAAKTEKTQAETVKIGVETRNEMMRPELEALNAMQQMGAPLPAAGV